MAFLLRIPSVVHDSLDRSNWLILNGVGILHTTTTCSSSKPQIYPIYSAIGVTSPPMAEVSEENKAAAAVLKAKANEAFKSLSYSLAIRPETNLMSLTEKDFMEAATLYGQALEKNDQDATIWCNRAFARMNLVSFNPYHIDERSSIKCLSRKSTATLSRTPQRP
jgi:hypothetical protein